MKISDLNAAKYNPRKISAAQLKRLGAAMEEFGDLSGIVFNRRTGNLVGGHWRAVQGFRYIGENPAPDMIVTKFRGGRAGKTTGRRDTAETAGAWAKTAQTRTGRKTKENLTR